MKSNLLAPERLSFALQKAVVWLLAVLHALSGLFFTVFPGVFAGLFITYVYNSGLWLIFSRKWEVCQFFVLPL